MGHQDDAVVQKNEAWVSFGRGCKLVAVFADGSTTLTDLGHEDVFNVEAAEPTGKRRKLDDNQHIDEKTDDEIAQARKACQKIVLNPQQIAKCEIERRSKALSVTVRLYNTDNKIKKRMLLIVSQVPLGKQQWNTDND